MFLDFAGTLVNLDHVAQVEPYTPGGGKQLVVILSNGNRVGVKDGEQAVELYRLMTDPTKPHVQAFNEFIDATAGFGPIPPLLTPTPSKFETVEPAPAPKPPKKGKAK